MRFQNNHGALQMCNLRGVNITELAAHVSELCVEKLSNDDESWYDWNIPQPIPVALKNPAASLYQRNLELKYALSHAIKASSSRREELISWYIRDWGGIRTNEPKTLSRYASLPPSELLSLGKSGIPSWSKALAIIDPQRYAIFDARVAASLNCLLLMGAKEPPALFPVLESRNNVIRIANREVRRVRRATGKTYIPPDMFYELYLRVLRESAAATGIENLDISSVEMVLFANAEDLSREAFPRAFA